MNRYLLSCLLLILGATHASHAQNFVATLTGNPVNTSGWTFTGSNSFVSNDEFVLTSPTTGQRGYIYYSTPQNLSTCSQFTVDFDFKMSNSSNPPADGLAFWYITNPPTGFEVGGGIGLPDNPNGLLLIMDTYNNDGVPDNPLISLRKMEGTGNYVEGSPTGRLAPDLTLQNFLVDGNWHHCRMTYIGGQINVYYDGATTPNISGNYVLNQTGYFGFSAATGASWSRHSIKNVNIVGQGPVPPTVVSPVVYCQFDVSTPLTATGTNLQWYTTATGGTPLPAAPTPNTGGAVTVKYYVSQTIVPGCESSRDSIEVIVNPQPALPDITYQPTYCQDQTFVPFTTTSTNVQWYTAPTGGTGSSTLPVVNTAVPGTYTWYATQTSAANCESRRLQVSVTVNPTYYDTTVVATCDSSYQFEGNTYSTTNTYTVPYVTNHGCDSFKVLKLTIGRVKANFSTTLHAGCAGDSIFFQNTTVSPGGNMTYIWDFGDGSPTSNVLHPYHVYGAQGNYTVTLIAQSDICNDTIKKTINWPRQVNLHSDYYYNTYYGCTEDTVVFYNSSTGAAFYLWDFGDGTSDTTTNAVHHYTQQGVYTVNLYAMTRNSGGGICIDTMTRTIDLVHPLHASFTVADDTICISTPITFVNTSVVTTKNGVTPRYIWDFGDGSTSSMDTPVHTYPRAGVYTVMLMATDFVPCTEVAYRTIVVDSIPLIDFSISDTVLCQGASITFTGNYTYWGNTGIQWTMGDGSVIPDVNPLHHAYDNFGPYTVRLDASYRRCPDTFIAKNIIVRPIPKIDLGPDTTICPNGEPFVIRDRVNSGNPVATWLWNNGETTSSIMIRYPGIYASTVTINGCSNSDSLTVMKDCYIDIPNAFTPDGDGVNDYFLPRQLLSKGAIAFKMSIFNRWGQQIYETTRLDGRGWDGRFNDKDQPGGVYVYLIEVVFKNGASEKYQGNVTLIR